MEKIIRELQDIARKCSETEAEYEDSSVKKIIESLKESTSKIAGSWSQSWLGYHAYIYYKGFKIPPPGNHFSSEWGFMDAFTNQTSGEWQECSYDYVYNTVLQLANNPDLSILAKTAKLANECLEKCRNEFITILEVVLSDHDDKFLTQKKKDAEKIKTFSQEEMIHAHMPSGQIMSRDSLAISQGLKVPPHMAIECLLYAQVSPQIALKKLVTLADSTVSYLQKKFNAPKVPMSTKSKIFIGHGNSTIWRDLKDFLQDRLHLEWDEFNRIPPAGFPTTERLIQMLDSANFAFIVMTAEDEHGDKSMHARENVIHESGLFQGRLGFHKAIILLEEGCSEFSNIVGLTQIRFPKGHIDAKFEEIRRILEREKII